MSCIKIKFDTAIFYKKPNSILYVIYKIELIIT